MIKFILKLAVFALIAAIGSFWATERFSSKQLAAGIAQAVVPITPISDLIRTPGKYGDSLVHISGKPVPYLKLEGLGIGGFVIEDESGNRIVILTKSGIPVLDATTGLITVVGIYKQLFEIGPYFYPVIVAS